MYKTLVLSMGNDMRGDDGIGPAVVRELSHSCVLPKNVELIDSGIKDFSAIVTRQDISRLIIVDAADMNLGPGEWRRLDLQEYGFEILAAGGMDQMHGLGLTQVLLLGEVLGTLPREIALYAIQSQMVGFRMELSEPVKRIVPEVCEAIQNELELTPQRENCSQYEITPWSHLIETRV